MESERCFPKFSTNVELSITSNYIKLIKIDWF